MPPPTRPPSKLQAAARYLRWGQLDPPSQNLRWFSLRAIAQHLSLTTMQVKRLLTDEDPADILRPPPRKRHRQLQEHHLKFLLDPQTLREWRPHSLLVRCRLFHRRFPDTFVSYSRLRSVYLQHGIKRRTLREAMALS